MTQKHYIFTRFERLWHWFQAIVVLMLLLSGFVIHGTIKFMDFSTAFLMHQYAAWAWLTSYIFLLFWLMVTGELKQYKPTTKGMKEVMHYYSIGIFKGAQHPHVASFENKHNSLQCITYDVILFILIPVQIISGLLYMYYNKLQWLQNSLKDVAVIHTIGAFGFLVFLIAHIYLATTGKTPTAHFKAMITGYED